MERRKLRGSGNGKNYVCALMDEEERGKNIIPVKSRPETIKKKKKIQNKKNLRKKNRRIMTKQRKEGKCVKSRPKNNKTKSRTRKM